MTASDSLRVRLRPAGDADIDAIAHLAIELHEFTARAVPGRLRLPQAYDGQALRERIRRVTEDAHAVMLVAEAEDEVVGFVEVHLVDDEPSTLTIPVRHGYVQSLVVAAAMRREGVGTRLMEAAEAWSSDRGATEVRLKVWEFEAGPLAFYAGMGYSSMSRELAKPLPAAPSGHPG